MYVLQELLKIWRKIASKFLLVYTGCSQKGGSFQHPLNPLFFGLFPMFGAYFDHSFWYFLATLLKKSWKTSSSKKGYISGLAQIGSFSADWNLGVADFEFNYLGHFFSIWIFFCPYCCKFPAFDDRPPTFKFYMVWKVVMDKKPRKLKFRKLPSWANPEI